MARVNQLEEKRCAIADRRQITAFVHYHHCGVCEQFEPAPELAGDLGLLERSNEVRKRAAAHAPVGFGGSANLGIFKRRFWGVLLRY